MVCQINQGVKRLEIFLDKTPYPLGYNTDHCWLETIASSHLEFRENCPKPSKQFFCLFPSSSLNYKLFRCLIIKSSFLVLLYLTIIIHVSRSIRLGATHLFTNYSVFPLAIFLILVYYGAAVKVGNPSKV